MRVVHMTISTCNECPFCDYEGYLHISSGTYRTDVKCYHENRPKDVDNLLFSSLDGEDTVDIIPPSWCPLPERETPRIDDLLLQEIFSLREQLKIAVAAIKSYDPDFDDQEFIHRLKAVDYEQLMEEIAQAIDGTSGEQ